MYNDNENTQFTTIMNSLFFIQNHRKKKKLNEGSLDDENKKMLQADKSKKSRGNDFLQIQIACRDMCKMSEKLKNNSDDKTKETPMTSDEVQEAINEAPNIFGALQTLEKLTKK